jgi:hypothetical protein
MKRLIIFAGLFFIIGASLSGCYKDVIIPASAVDPDGPPQATSYKTDIAPLLNTKCGVFGCHVAGSEKPDLETAKSYLALVNGGYVNTLIPKQSKLYVMINGEMQVHIPSAADRQKIYDWIRTGALNN